MVLGGITGNTAKNSRGGCCACFEGRITVEFGQQGDFESKGSATTYGQNQIICIDTYQNASLRETSNETNETFDAAFAFVKSIDKTPCTIEKELYGFVATRIFSALTREACLVTHYGKGEYGRKSGKGFYDYTK